MIVRNSKERTVDKGILHNSVVDTEQNSVQKTGKNRGQSSTEADTTLQ